MEHHADSRLSAAVTCVASQMMGNGLNSGTNEVHNAENVYTLASTQTFSALRHRCRIQMDQPQYYTDCIGDFSLRPGWQKNDELRSKQYTRLESKPGFHGQGGDCSANRQKAASYFSVWIIIWLLCFELWGAAGSLGAHMDDGLLRRMRDVQSRWL